MTVSLNVQAWFELLRIDLIHLRGFRALHKAVSQTPTRTISGTPADIGQIVNAVMRASFWYFRAPQCLQRSAAVTRLLRRRGVRAEMVLGCYPEPLKGHAWVEVERIVVSDHMERLEYFHVLDRW